MKFLLLLSLLTSLVLAQESRIILGSYTDKHYAKNALVRVNYLIRKDSYLKNFISSHELKVSIVPLEKYKTIAISNFKDYGTILQTKKAFSKYYKDLYLIPPYTAIIRIRITKKVIKTSKMSIRKESYTIKELKKNGENKSIENLLN